MKKASGPSPARNRKQKPGSKGGKRSLYNPELGASNWQAAQQGRFATRVASGEQKGMPRYPAYFAYKKLEGALIGLQRIRDDFKNIPLRVSAVAGQIEEGLRILRAEAKKAKRRGDKIRFAEAIIAALDPKGSDRSDRNVWRVCWRAIEMLTKRENPSQAELRRAVDEIDGLPFSDQEWKRLIKRTGLNRELLTHPAENSGYQNT
jgi:hypothetical protein